MFEFIRQFLIIAGLGLIWGAIAATVFPWPLGFVAGITGGAVIGLTNGLGLAKERR